MQASTVKTMDSATPVLTWGDLGFTLLMLLIVLFVILVLAWLAKRFNLGVAPTKAGAIQILSTTAVGAKERLVIVKIGQDKLLLGVTPSQIQMLKELPADFNQSNQIKNKIKNT